MYCQYWCDFVPFICIIIYMMLRHPNTLHLESTTNRIVLFFLDGESIKHFLSIYYLCINDMKISFSQVEANQCWFSIDWSDVAIVRSVLRQAHLYVGHDHYLFHRVRHSTLVRYGWALCFVVRIESPDF